MADLTSLYRRNPKRDLAIQTCVDCINFLGIKYPKEFIKGLFTDFYDITGGTQPPKSKFIHHEADGYERFLQIRDFSSEDTVTYIPENKNNKLCAEDDILLGRYGASIGKILTGKAGAYNVACAKISILEPELVNNDFLFYWLHSTKFQNEIKSFSRSAQGGFNKNDLTRIGVIVPTPKLQGEFVRLLKDIDNSLVANEKPILDYSANNPLVQEFVKMIEKFLFLINEFELLNFEYTHQLTQLENLNQAILQEAVQGKLVKQDPKDEPASELLKRIKSEKAKSGKKEKPLPPIKPEEIPFAMPESWVWCRLGEIGESTIGIIFKPAQVGKIGIPVLRANNVQNGQIDYSDLILVDTEVREKQIAKIGDILLCVRSGSNNLIGKAAMIQKKGMSFGAFMSLYRSEFNPYILKYMHSYIFKKQINDKKSTGINQLTQGTLNNIIIPLPPLSEQKRIVAEIEKQFAKTKQLKEHIIANQQATEQLLKALLHQAFEVKEMETA
jgi:type I restriction enzyme S subunit